MKNKIIYREVQYLRNKFLNLLVFFTSITPFVVFLVWAILQKGFDIEFGNEPLTDTNLILSIIFSAFFALFVQLIFRNSNLVIEVTDFGFLYKYFPFHLNKHTILPKNIIDWTIKPLRPLAEYGGWGIRYGFGGRGKGYIANGNYGVLFTFSNNKKILFSCQNSDKMRNALELVFRKN